MSGAPGYSSKARSSIDTYEFSEPGSFTSTAPTVCIARLADLRSLIRGECMGVRRLSLPPRYPLKHLSLCHSNAALSGRSSDRSGSVISLPRSA